MGMHQLDPLCAELGIQVEPNWMNKVNMLVSHLHAIDTPQVGQMEQWRHQQRTRFFFVLQETCLDPNREIALMRWRWANIRSDGRSHPLSDPGSGFGQGEVAINQLLSWPKEVGYLKHQDQATLRLLRAQQEHLTKRRKTTCPENP